MNRERNPEMITTPRISVYGVGDLNRLRRFEFEGEIGREIIDSDVPASYLVNDTITLADQAALFQAYVGIRQERELDTNDPFEQVLQYLFDIWKEKTNVTRDLCDYDNGDRGMRKVHGTDRRVLWKVIREEDYNILIPESGHVKCTNDGLYRPDTGTPFETTRDMEEAIRSMIDHGIPEELAQKIRSYFWSREEDQGTCAVFRSSGSYINGPFTINACVDFPDRFVIGRFPAHRSVSEASHADADRGELASQLEGIATRLRERR